MAPRNPSVQWRRLNGEADVVETLSAALPSGSSPEDITTYCAEQGLESSGVFDGMIKASAPARGRRPFVSAKWLITFAVPDGALTDITVELGLTGP